MWMPYGSHPALKLKHGKFEKKKVSSRVLMCKEKHKLINKHNIERMTIAEKTKTSTEKP